MTLAVLFDAFGGRAQKGIRKKQVACQLLKAARFVGLDAKQAQLELGRGPGEIHRSIDRVGIAVLVHQPQDTLARFTDPGPGHINCAQAMVHFALLVLGKDLDPMTTARYLGGGIASSGETCGVITGTALALGLRDQHLSANDPDLQPRTAESLRELMRDFAGEFGARRCIDLTGFDLSTPAGREAFGPSEARKRCAGYVSWMCDQLAPLLSGATTAPAATESETR